MFSVKKIFTYRFPPFYSVAPLLLSTLPWRQCRLLLPFNFTCLRQTLDLIMSLCFRMRGMLCLDRFGREMGWGLAIFRLGEDGGFLASFESRIRWVTPFWFQDFCVFPFVCGFQSQRFYVFYDVRCFTSLCGCAAS